MINLSIIIVNYNAREYLKKCIDSIFESKISDLEIIVVDNDSKDGSVEELEKFGQKIKLIANKKNVGFSKANNQGIKKASGRYILFLNPDTSVYPHTLKYMTDFMDKNREIGAATCKVVLANGKLDDSSHRGFPTPWNSFCYFSGLSKLFPHSRFFSGYTLGNLGLSTVHEIDALSGSFMFTRREAGRQAGWWDEDYFFYGEDLDFCYQLKVKGWKIYFVPQVSALHYKGISSGIKKISKDITTADLETKKIATKERFRAMRLFYGKHYKDKYPKLVTWLVMQGISLKFWFSKKSL